MSMFDFDFDYYYYYYCYWRCAEHVFEAAAFCSNDRAQRACDGVRGREQSTTKCAEDVGSRLP
eukprot:8030006-Heterocapsa_arctica.AAC.1